MENYFHLNMDRRAVNQISALGLAHCGDAVFELPSAKPRASRKTGKNAVKEI